MRIFQEALQRDPAQRDAFVREACQGDAALHREVSSLLANHEEGGIEPWAAAAAARLMAARGSLDPGTSLGSYRIERFLAAGGMGEVYGARDTKLGRQVYPGPGGKWQISTGGGVFPTWSRTARELFFGTPTQHIMVAAYEVEGSAFRAEKPRLWSDARYKPRGPFRPFDLHPDGKRFALAPAAPAPGDARHVHVTVTFNAFDELRRIAPSR